MRIKGRRKRGGTKKAIIKVNINIDINKKHPNKENKEFSIFGINPFSSYLGELNNSLAIINQLGSVIKKERDVESPRLCMFHIEII